MVYRAPKQIPGLDKEAERELVSTLASLQNELTEDPALFSALQAGSYKATPGEVVVMKPSGFTAAVLTLPQAQGGNKGDTVSVIFTAGVIAATVVAVLGTINGSASMSLNTTGLYVFKSDGVSGWWIAAAGGLTKPQVQTIASFRGF